MLRHYTMSEISKEWVNSLPKTINENGCWIPKFNIPDNRGYVRIWIEKSRFLLHRLSMCVTYNIDYYDNKIECRHGSLCSRACFNPEHLKPGTSSDNQKDAVGDGTHSQASKACCSKCGGNFRTRVNKTGINRGKVIRYCPVCQEMKRVEWRRMRREKGLSYS